MLSGKRQVQKIYSTSRYVCFVLRIHSKTIYLYLGRGKGYEGIWVSEIAPKSFLRKKDKLLELIRKNCKNFSIQKINIDTKDRLIELILRKGDVSKSFYYAWIGRNSYFAMENDQGKVLASWKSGRWCDRSDFDFSSFDEVGRLEIKKGKLKEEIAFESLLEQEEKDAEVSKVTKKIISKKNKLIRNIKSDIERLSSFIELKEKLIKGELDDELERANYKIKLIGIKLSIKSCENLFQKKDVVFNKIKSVEKALSIQEERISKLEEDETKEFVENGLKVIQPIWKIEKKDSIKKERTGNYSTHIFDSFTIGLGLSAQGNDDLRKWASKQDIWVHSAEGTSAHAIVKLNDQSKMQESLEQAAKLIRDKSFPNFGELDIIYTKVSDLKPVKGTPGLVRYKKEKHMRILF